MKSALKGAVIRERKSMRMTTKYTCCAEAMRLASISSMPLNRIGSRAMSAITNTIPIIRCTNMLLENMALVSASCPAPWLNDRCRWVVTTNALVMNPSMATVLPMSEKMPKSELPKAMRMYLVEKRDMPMLKIALICWAKVL